MSKPESLPARRLLADDALVRLAGPAVFDRGRRYFAEDRCRAGGESADASRWYVEGSALYTVDLALQADGLQGHCDCPYAEDEGFCKHLVGAALAWRQRRGDCDAPGEPSKAARRRGPSRTGQSLQDFLAARPAVELAQRLWAHAQRDRDLRTELTLWQAQEQAASQPDAWKAVLADVLKKTRDFYDWKDAADYARRAIGVLPMLQSLLARDPAAARAACMAALQRIWRVALHADDSNGVFGPLLHGVHDILVDTLRARPPQAEDAARWLRVWMDLQDQDPFGLWGDHDMLDAAGTEVRRLYAQRVAQDWTDWLAGRAGKTRAHPDVDDDGRRFRLRERFLADRRNAEDPAVVLEILASDVRSGYEVVQLANQLETMGRLREALQRLEAGARQFAQDRQVQDALLQAYERDGCVEEALAIRRRQLESRPDAERYAAALFAAVRAGRDAAAYREELFQWARERELDPPSWAWQGFAGRYPRDGTRDVTLRVQWLLHDRDPAQALELASAPDAHLADAVALSLARVLAGANRPAAEGLMRRVFESSMRGAQSPYGDQLALVTEWHGWLPPPERRKLLDGLRLEYKAKRNFIAGLARLPADCEKQPAGGFSFSFAPGA